MRALQQIGRDIVRVLEALPEDYYPKIGFDPYEEDCCGAHDVFTVTNSGLGVTLTFVDGANAYFDDDGIFVFNCESEL